MSLIEALSIGKPVIRAYIVGIPEIVIENTSVFLFLVGSVEELRLTVLKADQLNEDYYLSLSAT